MTASARRWRELPGVDIAVSVLIACVPVLILAALIEAARVFGVCAIKPAIGTSALVLAFSSQNRTTAAIGAAIGGWLIHG